MGELSSGVPPDVALLGEELREVAEQRDAAERIGRVVSAVVGEAGEVGGISTHGGQARRPDRASGVDSAGSGHD